MTDKLDLGAVSLAYETFGTGDPPLLLVHGYTGSKLDWTDVVAPLSATRRVLTFDHRGHGESTNTGDPASYTLDALLADLTGFVDCTIGDARFDLLGHSMGGVLAMRYTLDRPARVRSLVLMDSFSEPAGLLPEAFRTAAAQLGRDQGMDAVAALIRPFVAASGNLTPERAAEIGDRLAWKFEHLDVEAFVALADELSTFPSLTASARRDLVPDHRRRRRARCAASRGRRPRGRRSGRGVARDPERGAQSAGREHDGVARCRSSSTSRPCRSAVQLGSTRRAVSDDPIAAIVVAERLGCRRWARVRHTVQCHRAVGHVLQDVCLANRVGRVALRRVRRQRAEHDDAARGTGTSTASDQSPQHSSPTGVDRCASVPSRCTPGMTAMQPFSRCCVGDRDPTSQIRLRLDVRIAVVLVPQHRFGAIGLLVDGLIPIEAHVGPDEITRDRGEQGMGGETAGDVAPRDRVWRDRLRVESRDAEPPARNVGKKLLDVVVAGAELAIKLGHGRFVERIGDDEVAEFVVLRGLVGGYTAPALWRGQVNSVFHGCRVRSMRGALRECRQTCSRALEQLVRLAAGVELGDAFGQLDDDRRELGDAVIGLGDLDCGKRKRDGDVRGVRAGTR